MNFAIIAFALGVWLCQQQASLVAGWVWLVCCLAFAIVAMLVTRWRRQCSLISLSCLSIALWLSVALFAGLSFATLRAQSRLVEALPLTLESKDVVVTGSIADMPQVRGADVRFLFNVDANEAGVPGKVLLSWYGLLKQAEPSSVLPFLHSAERWQLTVRLKRPHGNANPHGFDYEAQMFERNIRAVGYVRPASSNQYLNQKELGLFPFVNGLRERIRARFFSALPDHPWTGMLVALVVGDQSGISQDQWGLFRQTGISHLVAISGLHITLIASLVACLVGFVWRRMPFLCLKLPAQKASIAAGVMGALFYAALAGFGVPSQRALYMLFVAAFALWTGRGTQGIRTWLLALWVVLLFDPWAVLSAGFWLSFAAVGALMLVASQMITRALQQDEEPVLHRRLLHKSFTWGRRWLGAQWAIVLITLPLLLGLFQQFSLVSPLVNLIAVPLVSLLVTPLALLFAVLPITALAQFAHWLTEHLMLWVAWFAAFPLAIWQQAAPPRWLIALSVMAGLWALLPRGIPARWTVLLVMLPLLAFSPARPLRGDMRVTVLDVGQGLSVHVQTASHDLLFDTGPRYGTDSDSGERVVVPYLRAQGVQRLDALIVSHNDMDHSGGAESIVATVPVKVWLSSLPDDALLRQRLSIPHIPCRRSQLWEWDNVRFNMLHPDDSFAQFGKDNNKSCVLHVASKTGSVLLPGDIERSAEIDLIPWAGEALHSNVLVAPHHGSRSSSSLAFVAAVGAEHVVFTNGYRNRFKHPNVDTVRHYTATGAQQYRSDENGAVIFDFNERGVTARSIRIDNARYWQGH